MSKDTFLFDYFVWVQNRPGDFMASLWRKILNADKTTKIKKTFELRLLPIQIVNLTNENARNKFYKPIRSVKSNDYIYVSYSGK